MPIERVQIVVTETGGATTARSIGSVGTAAKTSSGFIDTFKSALLGLGAAGAAAALISYSDAATRVSNSLKLAGLEGQKFTDTQQKLYDVAIANGQETESLAAIYQKLSATQTALNTDGQGIIDVTTGIAAAMRQSTAGTGAQAGALQQLSQLFGGTMVQAQEFNSLVDGAYPLLIAAAQGSSRWAGDVSKLRADVRASTVTTKEFFAALQNGLPALVAAGKDIPLTIGQSFVALKQSFQEWIALSPQANVGIGLLSSGIQALAQHMNVIAPTLAAFGVALATTFIGGTIVSAAANLAALGVGIATIGAKMALAIPQMLVFTATWIAANAPMILIIASVTAIGAGIAFLADKLFNGGQAWQSFEQASTAAITNIKSIFDQVLSFTGTNANIQIQGDTAANSLTKAGQTTAQTIKSYMDASGKTISVAIPQGAQTATPVITQAVKEGGDLAAKAISDSVQDIGKQLADQVTTSFDPAIDKLTAAFTDNFEQPATELITNLTTWATTFTTTLAQTFATAQTGMNTSLAATFAGFITNATAWGNSFIQAFNAAAQNAANALRSAAASAGPGPSAGGAAFATGGQFNVGGTGGTDSQKIAFMATPGERVTIETASQARQNDAAHNGSGPASGARQRSRRRAKHQRV
jgi:hypothetical protein